MCNANEINLFNENIANVNMVRQVIFHYQKENHELISHLYIYENIDNELRYLVFKTSRDGKHIPTFNQEIDAPIPF